MKTSGQFSLEKMIVLKFNFPQSFEKSKAMTFLSKLGIFSSMAGFLTMLLMAITLHAQPVSSPPQSKVPSKTWNQKSTVEKVQLVCALSALPIFFVAEIWFIVAGFQTSVGWGLFMLFIGGMRSIGAAVLMIIWMIQWTMVTRQSEPFHWPMVILAGFVVFAGSGAIIFIVRHWEHARKPLAVMGLGIMLILTVLALQITK